MIDWKMGDRLVHAGRPEWGVGEVRTAEIVVLDGKRCQRVTVRFERAGVKVLSTAFAELKAAGQPAPTSTPDGDPPSQQDQEQLSKVLGELPEAAADPFVSKKTRLEFSLGLYRFGGEGSSLLDWAASQTGLKDPLSIFTRHELEQLFTRFRLNLDTHVRKLVYEMKREDPAGLAAAAAAAPATARHALRLADGGR